MPPNKRPARHHRTKPLGGSCALLSLQWDIFYTNFRLLSFQRDLFYTNFLGWVPCGWGENSDSQNWLKLGDLIYVLSYHYINTSRKHKNSKKNSGLLRQEVKTVVEKLFFNNWILFDAHLIVLTGKYLVFNFSLVLQLEDYFNGRKWQMGEGCADGDEDNVIEFQAALLLRLLVEKIYQMFRGSSFKNNKMLKILQKLRAYRFKSTLCCLR